LVSVWIALGHLTSSGSDSLLVFHRPPVAAPMLTLKISAARPGSESQQNTTEMKTVLGMKKRRGG
jgi:hypothetical protein